MQEVQLVCAEQIKEIIQDDDNAEDNGDNIGDKGENNIVR